MFNRRDIIYTYDRSLDGLLTAVFESFKNHEIPLNIESDENIQQSLDTVYFHISTDIHKAKRVEKALREKISDSSWKNVFFSYLSNTPDKEMKILYYIHRCFQYGKNVNSHLNDKYVAAVLDTALYVINEAHKLKGFIRFSELEGGILYGEISPKNRVLPCLIKHFTARYHAIPFMINDLTHKECLVYNGYDCVIHPTSSVPILNLTENELKHRVLWKQFYESVEIKERHNEKCRTNNMPKRYWKHLVEMQ